MKKQTLLQELRRIECQLSPENLTCDGEASRSYVIKRARQLRNQRAKVVKALGYEPSFKELYGLV